MSLNYLEIARVVIPAILLGIVVGKFVVLRPYYLERIRPRFWLPIARKMQRRDFLKLLTATLLFVAAAIALAYSLVWLIAKLECGPLYSEDEYTFTILEKISPILLFFMVNFIAVFEEWIFRSILLEEFARRSRSRFFGLVLSALIFAVFHLSNPGTYPLLMVPLLGAGMLLGICYLVSGFASVILVHCIYNSISVLL